MKTLLESKIDLEPYGEDNVARSPIDKIVENCESVQETLNKISEHITELKNKYPEYNDYIYVYDSKYYGFGTHSFWYDLYGIK